MHEDDTPRPMNPYLEETITQPVARLAGRIAELEAQVKRLQNALLHHVEGKAYYMMRDQNLTVAEYHQLQRDLAQGAGVWPGDVPDIDALALVGKQEARDGR